MHNIQTLHQQIVFPNSVECQHAQETMVLSMKLPNYGSSPPVRISAELTHGAAIGQQYTVGWADIRSDCRANWFTAPNKDLVARSVVRVNYKIEVR